MIDPSVGHFDFFRTRVWRFGDTTIDLEKLVSATLEEQVKNPSGKQVSNSGKNWQSSFLGKDYDWLAEKYLAPAIDLMKAYSISLDEYEPYVKCMWINISGQGGFNQLHDHIEDDGFFSFVHYLELPESSKEWKNYLIFKSDRPSLKHINFRVTAKTELTSHEVKFQVYKGDMIYFPSWLEHRTDPMKPDSRKISISGNISLRQKKQV
jgi:uncharacterized protein (TIGR02466 family)